MNYCVKLNNLGVAYYMQGRLDHAIQFFNEALEIINGLISKNSESGLENQDDRCHEAEEACLQEARKVSENLEEEVTRFQELIKVSESQEDSYMDTIESDSFITPRRGREASPDQTFVFRIPFEMSRDGCTNIPLSHSALIGIFNLALSYHWKGIHECSPFYLRTAVRAYEIAYSQLTSDKACVCPIMLVAILNNLGEIHQRLGHTTRARRCFEHLLTALEVFVTFGAYFNLNDDLKDRFFSNVIHLILRDPQYAPAA
jgi:tetratricopeptide (TPR) repeat protein